MRAATVEGPSVAGRGRRRPQAESGGGEPPLAHWGPKWRRLLATEREVPGDLGPFDRTVRGMLNRISRENAFRILPLGPGLLAEAPAWCHARFAALMLNSYLQVIHTNRHARGLAMRSSDNVLPGYLDAMAPLLLSSPQLVTALLAWLARLLRWHGLCWPSTRLLLLAAREKRERDTLPGHSLGRLPADLIRGRILSFLLPPRAPAIQGPVDETVARILQHGEDEDRDVVALLAHFIMFSPHAIWPRVSAFGFSLVEAVLLNLNSCQEREVYTAASVLATLAQRVEAGLGAAGSPEFARLCREDVRLIRRLADRLRESRGDEESGSAQGVPAVSSFVSCRVEAALEKTSRVHAKALRSMEPLAA